MPVVCVCSRCNILISGKVIKEIPGSVASGTPCISDIKSRIVTAKAALNKQDTVDTTVKLYTTEWILPLN